MGREGGRKGPSWGFGGRGKSRAKMGAGVHLSLSQGDPESVAEEGKEAEREKRTRDHAGRKWKQLVEPGQAGLFRRN